MKKVIRLASAAAIVGAAFTANSAFATVFGTADDLGDLIVMKDTLVTPAGGKLEAKLRLFNVNNGQETGGHLDITLATGGAYDSRVTLTCKDWLGQPHVQTAVNRTNVSGTSAGDIRTVCAPARVIAKADAMINDR